MIIYKPAKVNQIMAHGKLITKEGLELTKSDKELDVLVSAGILISEEIDEKKLQAAAEKERAEAEIAKKKAEELAKQAEEAKVEAQKEEQEADVAEKKLSKKNKKKKNQE